MDSAAGAAGVAREVVSRGHPELNFLAAVGTEVQDLTITNWVAAIVHAVLNLAHSPDFAWASRKPNHSAAAIRLG